MLWDMWVVRREADSETPYSGSLRSHGVGLRRIWPRQKTCGWHHSSSKLTHEETVCPPYLKAICPYPKAHIIAGPSLCSDVGTCGARLCNAIGIETPLFICANSCARKRASKEPRRSMVIIKLVP